LGHTIILASFVTVTFGVNTRYQAWMHDASEAAV